MNILVYPMYSKQELNADSNYVVISSLIRQMRLTRPNWQWVVIFPDDKSEYKYSDDGFFSLPNVFRVPMRISPRKMSNAISFDGTWGDMLLRKIGFDIVWCNLVEVAEKIKNCGTSVYEDVGRPVVFAAHNYMMHKSLPYPWSSLEAVAFQQIGGALFSDWNVFDSEWCRQMFVETAQNWMLPSAINTVLGRSTLIPYGTLDPAWVPGPRENAIPVIAYNHRLQGYKNWRDTFDILQEIYDEGIQFRVKFLNNTADNTSHIAKLPFVDIALSQTHAEYIEKLKGCDLNVSNSSHETFCISAVESMALGQPFIGPDAMTFPEITGKKSNGYPYLFHNREEQKAMLRQLLTDRAKRIEWGNKVSEHVRANYVRPIWAERYARLFEERTGLLKLGTPPDVLEFAREKLLKAGRMEIRDYYNLIRDTKINGRIPISNQSFPIVKIARLVKHIGGTVRIINGQQYVWMEEGNGGREEDHRDQVAAAEVQVSTPRSNNARSAGKAKRQPAAS